jgi:hypothetical protein
MEELDTGEFDLDITGFSMDEVEELLTKYGDEYGVGSAGEQGRLDEKTKVKCPECGHEFET